MFGSHFSASRVLSITCIQLPAFPYRRTVSDCTVFRVQDNDSLYPFFEGFSIIEGCN